MTDRAFETGISPENYPRQLPGLKKEVSRQSLIEQHEPDPNDPSAIAALDRIDEILLTATVREYIPIIAEKLISPFSKTRRSKIDFLETTIEGQTT